MRSLFRYPELFLLKLFPIAGFAMGTLLSFVSAYGIWWMASLETNDSASFFRGLCGLLILAGLVLILASVRGLKSIGSIAKTAEILKNNGEYQKGIFQLQCQDDSHSEGGQTTFRFQYQNIGYVSFASWAPSKKQMFPVGQTTSTWSMEGFLFHSMDPAFLLLKNEHLRIWLQPESRFSAHFKESSD